jgi:hypothetical protein
MEMTMRTGTSPPSTAGLWVGRVLSALVILFLLLDGTMKVIGRPEVEATMAQLGYPPGLGVGLGLLILGIALLYAVPATSVLGAVLLTGLLGGTMATHLRAGSPLFSHLLFGFYLGVIAWGGLWLRDGRLRAVFPRQR